MDVGSQGRELSILRHSHTNLSNMRSPFTDRLRAFKICPVTRQPGMETRLNSSICSIVKPACSIKAARPGRVYRRKWPISLSIDP